MWTLSLNATPGLDAQSAVQVAKIMEKYNILYFEEPTIPNHDLMKYVSSHTTLPLAAGERIYTRWQYRPYFENGIHPGYPA